MLMMSALSAFTYIRLLAVIVALMRLIYIYSLCEKYQIHTTAVFKNMTMSTTVAGLQKLTECVF